MERDELLTSILNSDVNSEYPSEFKAQYDIMECLSEQQGITTFLVMDHNGRIAVAKCYDRSLWTLTDNSAILSNLDHKGLPKQIASFENENVLITVREYADGIPLSRYAQENELTQTEIIRICMPAMKPIRCSSGHSPMPLPNSTASLRQMPEQISIRSALYCAGF